jgi:hypothetical protein
MGNENLFPFPISLFSLFLQEVANLAKVANRANTPTATAGGSQVPFWLALNALTHPYKNLIVLCRLRQGEASPPGNTHPLNLSAPFRNPST